MRVPLPGCLKVVMPAPGAHARHENAAEEERSARMLPAAALREKPRFISNRCRARNLQHN
jgi:hypothetical protein